MVVAGDHEHLWWSPPLPWRNTSRAVDPGALLYHLVDAVVLQR